MRAEQSNDQLRATQAVDNFRLPVAAAADLTRVLPDVVPGRGQIDAQPVGQFRAVAAAVAQKQLEPGGGDFMGSVIGK